RAGGRNRRQQGERVSGRREAVALPGRRRNARLDVPPRTRGHWGEFVSSAGVAGPAFSRSHGARTRDREESARGAGGCGGKPAAGARSGSRTGWVLSADPQSQVGQAGGRGRLGWREEEEIIREESLNNNRSRKK